LNRLPDGLRFQLPFLGWALVIFVASSIPSSSFPDSSIFEHDKLGHAGIFFVFAYLAERALAHQTRFPVLARYSGWWTLSIALAYGVLDEFHQSFVPGRSPDIFDVLADVLGASLFLLTLWFWKSRRQRASQAR
jgi:VanZ family protein